MNLKSTSRKGLSPIISTILLILISVTAVLLVVNLIIPFIKENLSEGKDCFDSLGILTIDTESGYTCYYEDGGSKILNVTISRFSKDSELKGFKIGISGGGESESFDIIGNTQVSGVTMLDDSLLLEIPASGEERTYSITTSLTEINTARLAPIMKSGKTCDSEDYAEIEMCY